MPDWTDIVEQLSCFSRATRSPSALRAGSRALIKPNSRISSRRCRYPLLNSRRTCEQTSTLAGISERRDSEHRARASNRREPTVRATTSQEGLRALTVQIDPPNLRHP